MSDIESNSIFEDFDRTLKKVRHKVAQLESRLDLAISDFSGQTEEESEIEAFEEQLEERRLKEKSRETIRKWKEEMGRLQEEIESEAKRLEQVKSIGHSSSGYENQNDPSDEQTRDSGSSEKKNQNFDVSGGKQT